MMTTSGKQMYEPIFQRIPDDWRERWRLIRTMISRVYEFDMPDVGRVPRLPRALKLRLGGKRLPGALVEWMAFGQDLTKYFQKKGEHCWPYSYRVEDFPAFKSLSLNEYAGCMRWGVAYNDFCHDDPPVSTYAYVERRNGFVLRKSFGTAPLTEWALHCALMHTPWFDGWVNYCHRDLELKNAKALIEKLRRTKGVQLSDPFGSVTFTEGLGWVAYVVDGYCHFGRQKFVRLYSNSESRVRDIPRPLRDLLDLKRSAQLH